MTYNKSDISRALERSQVKPGLFGRGPSQLHDQEAHDDYWGLGAMTGVCRFHNVAHDLLAYGQGSDQSSGATVAGLHLPDFGSLDDTVRQCKTIPYNYNNASPGTFTWSSWMGRYPALITHWKIADGNEFSRQTSSRCGPRHFCSTEKTAKEGDTNPWLLGWIQVLTYQMSQNYSAAADFAVAEWWKMLHARYPDGGIKQVMKDHLAGEAPTHPLAK